MKNLKKRRTQKTNSIECYAQTLRGCACITCSCPPPSVPNDIQLLRAAGAQGAASVYNKYE